MDLRTLLPSMWLRNHRTDRRWDTILRTALEAGAPVERLGEYTGRVGTFEVWLGNWPYAYGSPHGDGLALMKVLPSRRTALMLHDVVPPLEDGASPLDRYLAWHGVR